MNRQTAAFGRRKEPHTVIIAHGDSVRHFTVRPWIAAFAGSALAALAVGYLLATTYLVLRDDIIGAATARQARMQQAYEDRISALRAQVDRITSRQMLDQQIVENKVAQLLRRQDQLLSRHGKLGPVLERAEKLTGELEEPVHDATPMDSHHDQHADASSSEAAPAGLLAFAATPAAPDPFKLWAMRDSPAKENSADRADRMFVAVNRSLKAIETRQMDRLSNLTDSAYKAADTLASTLEDAGLLKDKDYGREGMGGPLVPANPAKSAFDNKVEELDTALDALQDVQEEARRLPLANPAPGTGLSSGFGVRLDPIIGVKAMHTGLDFRAPLGTAARVTAPGVVTRAGWNGGYGRMVEVDHGNGYVTRYAHLGKILVSVGQKLAKGAVVGRTGTSGRSTGPHLHYEVRHDGAPVNPMQFLKVGKKVEQLL